MGRASKLTDEVQTRIVEGIELGATYALAAAYGGISYKTFNEWMNLGEEAPAGKYRAFRDAIKLAEGKGALKWLRLIDAAANDGAWQAAAWKLERRYPQDYGRTVVDTNHNGKVEHWIVNIGAPDEEAS